MNKITLSKYSLQAALISLLLVPAASMAEWKIVTHTDVDSETSTQVAYTENAEGYSLEIYKDNVGAIRSRFSLSDTLDSFAKRSCPTYQIDARLLDNRSINDAPCLTQQDWSEYILGYIVDDNVTSRFLNALVNGSNITFRYMLDNGNYKETGFSLAGSKRATLTVLGANISITTP